MKKWMDHIAKLICSLSAVFSASLFIVMVLSGSITTPLSVLFTGEEQQRDRLDLQAEGAAAGAGAGGELSQGHQGSAGGQEQDQSDHRGSQVGIHEG